MLRVRRIDVVVRGVLLGQGPHLLSREQNHITTGLAAVQKELEALARDTATSHAHIKAGLALLEDCAATYRAAPDHIKNLLNQAFFEKILINPESPSRPASSAVQAVEALTPLIGTITAARANHAQPQDSTCEEPPVNGRLFDRGGTDEPAPGIRHAQGFRPATLVELRGLDPHRPGRCAPGTAWAHPRGSSHSHHDEDRPGPAGPADSSLWS